MAWDGKVTNVGLSLLEQWGTGSQTLHIDKATIGTGTVPSASLIASTTVAGEIGETPITGSSVVTGGIQYQVQVQTQTAAYTLHQIGVWGHLGDSGTATLIAVFQEEDGINIPAEADEPGYALTVYCTVAMSNTGSITINLSGGAYATLDMMNAALALKAPIASPTLTGTPTAPTAAAGTNTTQIATTAFATQGDEALQEQINDNTYLLEIPDARQIPANSDLDTYLTPREYICRNATTTGTISNVPFSGGGFRLSVERYNGLLSGNDRMQVIKCDNGWFYRCYRSAQSTWSTWTKFAPQAEVTAIEQGIAILATGNTHAAITSGQYVFVRNHITLADGLYKASANIAANDAMSTSNLVADSSGGLNSLKAGLDTLNSKIDTDPVLLSDCYDASDPRKVYYANGTTSNRPSGADWWFIRCVAKTGSMKFLVAYKMNVLAPIIYGCSFSNSGNTNGWYSMVGS